MKCLVLHIWYSFCRKCKNHAPALPQIELIHLVKLNPCRIHLVIKKDFGQYFLVRSGKLCLFLMNERIVQRTASSQAKSHSWSSTHPRLKDWFVLFTSSSVPFLVDTRRKVRRRMGNRYEGCCPFLELGLSINLTSKTLIHSRKHKNPKTKHYVTTNRLWNHGRPDGDGRPNSR